MSRELPPNPNLEHLRKQAKNLLHELQEEQPALQLSDAQHAVAKQYGFASWPRLKAHVESLRSDPSAVQDKLSPMAGTWIANPSKSTPHPANRFRSATLHFEVSGDTVTITDVVVDASGHEERGRNTIEADGIERSTENGYLFTGRWSGSNVLEIAATKDGQRVDWGRYEVSADGKTMTISAEEQVIMVDRQ